MPVVCMLIQVSHHAHRVVVEGPHSVERRGTKHVVVERVLNGVEVPALTRDRVHPPRVKDESD